MRRAGVFLVLAAVACSESTGGKKPSDGVDPPTDDPGTTVPPPTTPPPPAAPVTINEIMPGNWSTVNGPDGYTLPDWVELLNTGDEAVPVARLQLRNASSDVWVGTDQDGEIEPGGRLLVWLGYQEADDGVWTGWNVEKDADTLILISDNATIVEEVSWELVGGDVSLTRIPDGTGEFVQTAWPTPGEVNGDAPSPTLDPADETFFRSDIIHRIDFTFTEQAYDAIGNGDRPEVHVEMEIDGVKYADVGLKLKGSASYDDMAGKPAFIVDLNEWVLGTKYRGLQAFKLHNGNVLDPTRTRDHLSYRFARDLGLVAPRVGWAEVYCNDIHYGIYIVVEKHDDVMIERQRPGMGDLSLIFEPNEASGWSGMDFGSGSLSFNYEEGPEPMPAEAQDALNYADMLIAADPQPADDTSVAEFWTVVDKDKFLTYLAWEGIAMHTDGYKAPNNWRVYVDGTTWMIEWSPSGAEWTWDSPTDLWSFGGAAGGWCLSNAGCRRDYAEKVLEVVDRAEALDLQTEFVTLSEWLDPSIDADPRYSEWWESVDVARSDTFLYLGQNPGSARNAVYAAYPDLVPP